MVVWLIGMSGAGKTVIGQEVCRQLKKKYAHVVFFDGDVVRSIMGNDLGHSLEARLENAKRINRLCHYLDQQGIHVICGILSIFPESQVWNRTNIKDYFEVYIKTSLETLLKRDSKGLYRKVREGHISNIVGFDIPFPEPLHPDLVVENNGDKSIEHVAHDIVSELNSKNFSLGPCVEF
ncbi:MAG: adenylyl-sulfate kinase [Deltaproteobacteria bacterium]|nr:adenylyl-sulfate kinase [Deltaproteobacteria bacterium]